MSKQVIWCGPIGGFDDFDAPIKDQFIDGKTIYGPWAIMSPSSWQTYGGTGGRLGLGFGQRYEKQQDGKWLKVEG